MTPAGSWFIAMMISAAIATAFKQENLFMIYAILAMLALFGDEK